MMTKTVIDPLIVSKKAEDIIRAPVIILVNEFTEASFKSFQEEFQKACDSGQTIIPIVIDSYGGHSHTVMGMLDIIDASPLPVATIAQSKAMSCGSILLAAGTEGYRFASPMASIMIHDCSSMSWGKTEETLANVNEVKRLNDLIYRQMAHRCGKRKDYFLDLIHEHHHADLYLDAHQALNHNLVNHIRIPTYEVTVSVTHDLK